MNFLLNWLVPVYNDAPEPWKLSFQDGASPTFEGITELHDTIFFYLVVIGVGVFWIMGVTMINFSESKSQIVYKHFNHGTLIELVWTITPAFILIAIAFPSFKLLYLMDSITRTIFNTIMSKSIVLFKSTVQSFSIAIERAKPIFIKNITTPCTAIVPYGVMGNSNGIKLSQYARDITVLTETMRDQIIGHILGDGSLTKSYTSKNAYFVFTQTSKRFFYIMHIFSILGPLCLKLPTLGCSLRKGIRSYYLQIHSRSYPFFSNLYNLFYFDGINPNPVKRIPTDLLFYLNPNVLAVWCMDDGNFSPSGFYLHTNNFSFNDVYKLAAMLHYVFELTVNVQRFDGKPVLYVPAKQLPKFYALVKPYILPEFAYKFRHQVLTQYD